MSDIDRFIKLDDFLKIRGVAETGGHAKMMIQGGEVKVNDQVETRRGKKLRIGDKVSLHDQELIMDPSDFD